jgi:hypothetical protein
LNSLVSGPYEPDHVTGMINQLAPDIRECFIATEFDPVEHTYTNFFVKIAPDGSVKETGAPGTDERSVKLDQCMDQALRKASWGHPPGDLDLTEIRIGFAALPAWRSQ